MFLTLFSVASSAPELVWARRKLEVLHCCDSCFPGHQGWFVVPAQDNGHVLPEAAIPADRAKDISGRKGPIG